MLKLTVIMDNIIPNIGGAPCFAGEAGLSYLIEYQGQKILFDTGQSGAIIHNLSLLGVQPMNLDMIVLSHNHYDHTGGLLKVLQQGGKRLPVYANKGIFEPHYAVTDTSRRFIGIPFCQEQLTALGADWHLSDGPQEILPNLILSGKVPRVTDFEKGDGKFRMVCSDGCECLDIVEDDASLYYKTDRGLVVIGGCTHSGLVNTVEHGLVLTGLNRLAGWIGGTHLGPVAKEQQELTLDALERYQPDFVASSHCTGFNVMTQLRSRFGEKFIPAVVSTVIEI